MTARRPSFWWLLAIPAACVFVLGMSDPALFIWAGVGLLIGYAIAASWMWGVWRDKAVAAESEAMFAKAEVKHLKRLYGVKVEITAVDNFTESMAEVARATNRLRSVPTQRDPEHDRLAMSAEEWAAIERETREL